MCICLPSLSPKKYKNSDLFDQTVRNNKMSLRKSRVLYDEYSLKLVHLKQNIMCPLIFSGTLQLLIRQHSILEIGKQAINAEIFLSCL